MSAERTELKNGLTVVSHAMADGHCLLSETLDVLPMNRSLQFVYHGWW